MASRDDWASSRNRGWARDRDWETDDDDYSERYGRASSEALRGRWGASGPSGRGSSFGQGSRGGWEREQEGFRDYGDSIGERRGSMSDRDWERYSGEGFGRYGESYGGRYGRGREIGGFGGEGFREGYGRVGYGREGSVGYGVSYGRGYGIDWRRGPHAGRGPKGWKRSDERIQEDVNEALARHPDLDASSIEVRVVNAEVTLTGVVEDRSDKRLAEDIAEEVFGVEDVHNELKIRHGAFARVTGEKADEQDERQARQGATTSRTPSTNKTVSRTRS
jgi:hypothetical protein